MKYWYFSLLLVVFLLNACGDKKSSEANTVSVEKRELNVAPDYDARSVVLPEGFDYRIIFQSGDTVSYNGGSFPAKENLDLIVFVPGDSEEEGQLYISHELKGPNSELGDGGGATLLDMKFVEGEWMPVGRKRNVDFSGVGYTENNCGGKISCNNTVLTAEESVPWDNESIAAHYSDLDAVNGLEKWENIGYMVEVDPEAGKAMHKLVGMGRYKHEDAICMEDGRTFYLTNDDNPAVFFKYVSDEISSYATGQLFAYDQYGEDHWIALPRDTATMINAKEEAIKRGATLFQRHEWVTQVGNKLYITETGYDNFDWAEMIALGGKPASYFDELKVEGDVYDDPYGRILQYDLETEEMSVLLDGGSDSTGATNFSNPDCINHVTMDGKHYLIVSEDVYVGSKNRMNAEALAKGYQVCEIYLLDLSIQEPKIEDLKRFMVAPNQSETTGIYFSPDRKTMFVNIQHPASDNPPPFNKSTTIAVTGF